MPILRVESESIGQFYVVQSVKNKLYRFRWKTLGVEDVEIYTVCPVRSTRFSTSLRSVSKLLLGAVAIDRARLDPPTNQKCCLDNCTLYI